MFWNRYVYVATFGPRIKIGVTLNPEQRFARLSAQTGHPAEHLAILRPDQPGCRSDLRVPLEADLHRRFAEFRLDGEWFTVAQPIVRWATQVSSLL